jgi:hypothetical protein
LSFLPSSLFSILNLLYLSLSQTCEIKKVGNSTHIINSFTHSIVGRNYPATV